MDKQNIGGYVCVLFILITYSYHMSSKSGFSHFCLRISNSASCSTYSLPFYFHQIKIKVLSEFFPIFVNNNLY